MIDGPWVFDVDGCLVDSLTGTSLRPGAVRLLEHLRDRGHELVLWSAGGPDYAAQRADEHGIGPLFHGFHGKAERDADGRYVAAFLADVGSGVFVDDRPEDMPVGARVVAVSPYLAGSPHDRGLRDVYEAAGCSWSDASSLRAETAAGDG